MRQDEAIASIDTFLHVCSTIRLTSILINIQVATENTINFDVSRYYNYISTNTQTICSIAQHFCKQHYSLSLIYSLFKLYGS